ncbi:hypothetical protein [Nakamurella leprariae]|uniref:NHLP leader peptide family natural product n=1 Tax=Nakamurella leprariae TaxID=2803911 RepID=A0A938YCW5_9ACTN|nr:hypothetical protein [Nakamurella leprariae]MBM9466147.1 hypothetical protein [Nakamurella leprariae]
MNLSDIQIRSATDPAFRAALLDDPRAVFAGLGVEVPDGITITVEESTPTEFVLAIPPVVPDDVPLDDDALAAASGGTTPVTFTSIVPLGASAAVGVGFVLGKIF